MPEPTEPQNPTPEPDNDPTSATPAPTEPASAAATASDDLANLDPGDLADMVRKLRKENAGDRTRAKQNAAEEAESALVNKLGKALGLVKDGDDDQLDPDQLTQQLTAAQHETQTLRVERAAERAARASGLDADALLDSRGFADKLAKLDSSGDTFDSDLESLVKEYADNPRYKTAGQAPARSGGTFSGGPGQPQQFTREQIARMSPAEYAANRDAIMAQLGQTK